MTERYDDGENGRAVPGTLVEVWQASTEDIYPHPGDPRHGEVEPGAVPGRSG